MSYIGNQPYQVAFMTDQFSGTGSQTAFTMSVAPATPTAVLVAVSGVLQDPSTYSVNGLTLTFSAAPPAGTANISCRYLGIPASGVVTTAYRTVTEITATANQTVFTPPSYTVGFINVYRNGVRLGSADITATNGTTVTLLDGATAGDLVTIESFLVSSVLNAIPNTVGAVTNANLGAISTLTTPSAKTITIPDVAGTAMISGNMPAFGASDAATTATAGVATLISFDTTIFDTSSAFNGSRFQPTVAGYYQVNGAVSNSGNASASSVSISIYKNGSFYSNSSGYYGAAFSVRPNVSTIIYLNGSTDYIELYGLNNGNSNLSNAYFSAALIRSA